MVLGNVDTPYPLGTVALGLQSLRQALEIGLQVLRILGRRHPVHPAGRLLVEVAPAVPQELGVQVPVEVLKPVLPTGFRLGGYRLQEGWLVWTRPDSVRHDGPVQAAYFRQVLPHVHGFPMLRVLRLIRLPNGMRRAFPLTVLLRLPAPGFHIPA
jgi:hypothetical protein